MLTSTVLAWPPSCECSSNSVSRTRGSFESAYAAPSAAAPQPTSATWISSADISACKCLALRAWETPKTMRYIKPQYLGSWPREAASPFVCLRACSPLWLALIQAS
jgi:hypothetical protein